MVQDERRSLTSDRAVILGGLCWILTLEFFVGQAIAQLAWTGAPYSLTNNEISDLGVTVCETVKGDYLCSPLHNVMNVSFVLAGIFILLGLYFTRHAWPKGRVTRIGLSFLVFAGLGKITVGLSPENVDPTAHIIGSLGFIFSGVGLVLLGRGLRQWRRWVANLSLVLGIISIIGSLLLFPALALNHDGGAAERLADYPMFVWFSVLGVCLLGWAKASGSSSHASSGLLQRPEVRFRHGRSKSCEVSTVTGGTELLRYAWISGAVQGSN